MILTTGERFDRIRVGGYPDTYHGLVVEFQPDGANAVSGSPTLEFTVGFVTLPSGQVGLTVHLPPESTFKNGVYFVLVNDKLGSKKITLENGIELERVK